MKKTLYLVTLLVVLGTLASCSGRSDEDAAPKREISTNYDLVDTSWRLTEIVSQPIPAEWGVTMSFDSDSTITGFGGCDDYRGLVTLHADTLIFFSFEMSEVPCETDEIQSELPTILAGKFGYYTDSLNLYVTRRDYVVAKYEKALPPVSQLDLSMDK